MNLCIIPGTYVAVQYDQQSTDALSRFILDNEILDPIPAEDLHTTVIYSRNKCYGFLPFGLFNKPITVQPVGFEVFSTTNTHEDRKCLVLLIESEFLQTRHDHIRGVHHATHDFPDYRPHITLSYNFKDRDIDELDYSSIGNLRVIRETSAPIKFS